MSDTPGFNIKASEAIFNRFKALAENPALKLKIAELGNIVQNDGRISHDDLKAFNTQFDTVVKLVQGQVGALEMMKKQVMGHIAECNKKA